MADFLLELLSEEIPARMQAGARNELARLFAESTDEAGRAIGVVSLRLGEPPVNLAIPIEKFLAGRDELVARGRVTSRAPRPWLGLYTVTHQGGGVIVAGLSPVGPAGAAAPTVDLPNATCLPGLIDVHTHIWSTRRGKTDLAAIAVTGGDHGRQLRAQAARGADRPPTCKRRVSSTIALCRPWQWWN